MRLEIRYRNEFEYDQPARESHNLLRACPVSDARQTLEGYSVEVTPHARVFWYVDHWGTRVDEFGVREAHDALVVQADSVVVTRTPAPVTSESSVSEYSTLIGDFVPFLAPSPHTVWDDRIREQASDAIHGIEAAQDAVAAIADLVHEVLAYEPGSTFVGVLPTTILANKKGVCQDFAHLAVAMYRSVGIPARYVSGYLYSTNQNDAVAPDDPELDVQTHAWIEAWLPGHGWWELDPTNPQPIGELHVKIGHGRDYDDVMPLKGVYHGASKHELDVNVRISRNQFPAQDQIQRSGYDYMNQQ
jgi:transglutaminase-like putative cysteine protease